MPVRTTRTRRIPHGTGMHQTDMISDNLDSPRAAAPPWQGVTIGRYQIAPAEYTDYLFPLYNIDVHLSPFYYLEWKRNRRYERIPMPPNALCICPIHEPTSLRWHENLEILKVTLTHSLLVTTADSLKMRGEIIIPERHGDIDPQITHICQTLWTEAHTGYPLGRVFGESLGTALASCLLQRYSDTPAAASSSGKLSSRSWSVLQDFVEEQLQNDISLEDMAQVARLSPYHFARCFKETSGMSPHQYLIARRVERARHLLKDADLSLAQIAVLSGFADQSHLTRHMKRILGQTPNAIEPRRRRSKAAP